VKRFGWVVLINLASLLSSSSDFINGAVSSTVRMSGIRASLSERLTGQVRTACVKVSSLLLSQSRQVRGESS
jgi:hypothetical protein